MRWTDVVCTALVLICGWQESVAAPTDASSTTETELRALRESPSPTRAQIEALLETVHLSNYPADGERIGVRVGGIDRRSLAHRLGLKTGDVVLSVNGQETDSPDRFREAFLEEEEVFQVEFRRLGGLEQLVIVIDDDGGANSELSKAEVPSAVLEASRGVSRDSLVRYGASLNTLGTLGRARLHLDESGNPDGFRLAGIRRTSLGAKLGLQTGDIIHSVNGKALTKTTEAVKVMRKLGDWKRLSVEITRDAQRRTLEYSVE